MPNSSGNNLPAIGTISDPSKVQVAFVRGGNFLAGPPLSVVADAVGVPSGGTTGQVLTKSTDADYDSAWADIPTQGDLSGPASAVDGNFAAFDGTTGKLVKDSGKKASDFQPALGYTPANVAGDTFTGGISLGSAAAPGGVATDLSRHLALYGTISGFSITSGRMNYVVGGTDRHVFIVNGTDAIQISNSGLRVGNPTGGDPGAGKVNATEYQINGTALPLAKSYESAQQTITAAGSLTLAHGLGGQPKLYQAFLVCQTAELGYSVGNEVAINPGNSNISTSDQRGLSLVPDATNINIRFGAAATTTISGIRKDTGAAASFTNTNWKLIVRAWL